MRKSREAILQNELFAHRKFMRERGDSLAGYLAFYKNESVPRERVRDMYFADLAFANQMETALDLTLTEAC